MLERSLSLQLGEGTSGIPSACFTAGSPGAPGTPGGRPKGAEEMMLGQASGTEGAHGKWAAPQRDSSAQEQLLCKAQQG